MRSSVGAAEWRGGKLGGIRSQKFHGIVTGKQRKILGREAVRSRQGEAGRSTTGKEVWARGNFKRECGAEVKGPGAYQQERGVEMERGHGERQGG